MASRQQSIEVPSSRDGTWEDGVSIIESILDPQGSAIKGLTETQKSGLMNLRVSLLQTSSGQGTAFSIIPKELLTIEHDEEFYHRHDSFKHLTLENGVNSSPFDGHMSSDISNYLLGFAGVTKRKKKKTLKDAVKLSISSLHIDKNEGYFNKETIVHEFKMMSDTDRIKVKDMLTWEKLQRWDFNIMELARLTNNKPLFFVGFALLGSPRSQRLMSEWCDESGSTAAEQKEGYNFQGEFGFDDEVLCNFLRVIEADYNPVPYHCSMHAADVAQTVHTIMQMGGIQYAPPSSSKIILFSVILAALVHDLHHPGTSNDFQIHAQTELAIQSNDVSVLENMHLVRTFQKLVGKHRRPEMDILHGLDAKQFVQVRKIIISSILHTDMANHRVNVNSFQSIAKLHCLNSPEKNKEDYMNGSASLTELEVQELFGFMLHIADISAQTKPAPLFVKWGKLISEEFYQQGDQEKLMGVPISPLCDRTTTNEPASQTYFLEIILLPAFQAIAEVIPEIDKQVLPQMKKNIEYYRNLLESKKHTVNLPTHCV